MSCASLFINRMNGRAQGKMKFSIWKEIIETKRKKCGYVEEQRCQVGQIDKTI